jgi:hypothetical protein
MFRKLVTTTIVALALIGASASRASADTCANPPGSTKQFGPFCIEGTVPDVSAAAAVTTLTANVTKTATSLSVASTSNFAIGEWVLIDQEKMLIGNKTALTLTVTRARFDTTAATHSNGARVVDLKSINNDLSEKASELGPKNANTTKLNVINTAAVPMLDLTNPNGQTDLNTVWLKSGLGASKVDSAIDHLWLYYAWARDANSGSGFISLELNKNGSDPVACKYDTLDDATLAAGCNPFAARSNNDLMFVWDQSGSSHNVYVRRFVADPITNVGAWSAVEALNTNVAGVEYSPDLFRGEMAVDLSVVDLGASGGCITFANVIPGTVTGNSDQADYKDVVLKIFQLVSNCGTVTVKKITSPAKSPGEFKFNLHDGTNIFPDDVDADCADANDHSQCLGTLTVTSDQEADPIVTIQDLAQGNYKLVETVLAANFVKTSIVCTPETGSAVNLTTDDTPFPVNAGETTACVITNSLVPGTLRVTKVVVNGFGLNKTCADFKFTKSGTAEQAWTSPACYVDFTGLAAGSQHSVTETTGQTGYGAQLDNCTNVTIVAGQTQTCTITNTAEQNGLGAVTRQRVLLFDRAILSAIRRDQSQSDDGTMSVKFIAYDNSAACSADATGAGSGETVAFNIPGTDTAITVASTGTPAIEIKRDTAGTTDATMWWRAKFHQTGTNPPNADSVTPCTETTRVVIVQ